MLFLLVSYSPLARRQVRASIYPVSRASAWLVVAAPAPPKPTKTREFAARQETAAKTLKVLNSLGLRASRAMATVVESEEVKTDEEKAVKKVVEEENEPESAGGCDVCLPLLKTPYAIGTIAALFLHLLLPEDRVLDEEKEGYPRAFES